MNQPIPSAADWKNNLQLAVAESLALAKTTSADGDSATTATVLGIASQVVAAVAPLASAIPGAGGPLASLGLNLLATSLASQHTQALATLTAEQQAAVTAAIQVGAAAATAALAKKG